MVTSSDQSMPVENTYLSTTCVQVSTVPIAIAEASNPSSRRASARSSAPIRCGMPKVLPELRSRRVDPVEQRARLRIGNPAVQLAALVDEFLAPFGRKVQHLHLRLHLRQQCVVDALALVALPVA